MSSGSETDRLDFVPSAAILLNVLLIAYCSVLFIGLPRPEYFDIIIILSCLFTDNPFRNDYYLQKLIIWISQLGPPPPICFRDLSGPSGDWLFWLGWTLQKIIS